MERENKIHNEILPTTKKADSKSKISDKEFFLKVSFFRTFFRTFFLRNNFFGHSPIFHRATRKAFC